METGKYLEQTIRQFTGHWKTLGIGEILGRQWYHFTDIKTVWEWLDGRTMRDLNECRRNPERKSRPSSRRPEPGPSASKLQSTTH